MSLYKRVMRIKNGPVFWLFWPTL